MKKCQNCGWSTVHDWQAKCQRCGALLSTPQEIDGRDQALAQILVISTPSVEGRKVARYLGLVSAEVVLGTGFLSELGAGLADLLGARADEFQGKLKQAKDAAMRELKLRALELEADAILGVDLDYSVLGHNMLMVVANGTAVRLAPPQGEDSTEARP
jgi:uncharacterized protein YbjQ (UPF0145 family)